MLNYRLKYGKANLHLEVDEDKIIHTLTPNSIAPLENLKKSVVEVLENPTGTKPLKEVINSGEKIAIVVSDITRLWIKTNYFLIHIVNYLNEIGINDHHIEVIIALGTHRASTEEEKEKIVGKEVYDRVMVYDHDCFNNDELVYLGASKLKTPIYINKRVMEADRIIITGGILFHLFAGFGGGAKSIVPGVAGLETIQYNHRLTFNEGEGTGLNTKAAANKIQENPMREDITDICRQIKPDFLFNVVLDTEGNFIRFVGGDFELAWLEGCDTIRNMYGIEIQEKADIIIASAGGYPKDINLYQTVKTMDNCLYGGKEGSVIILASECSEGLGAEEFLEWFQYKTLEEMEGALKQNFTVPGYAAYKTAYTAKYRKLILISALPKVVVEELGFIPAKSVEEALNLAYQISSKNPKITLMPYGGNTLPIMY
ncbi:NPN-dependent 2-hydroxyacid racemase, LarAH10 family [Alkaliphilus transvaalensis]|uniref:nickel-dependent lactate racemase n=1 Tax=Alkaliphilus transvaalensis TaxID=114628 RepID=UPI00047DE05D|nr:nickel-dependent lactate racemase [Alkaliphilus transvaalensis]